jgi:hypothetical protein
MPFAYTIKTKTALGDDYVDAPSSIRVDSVSFDLAPRVRSAKLSQVFGVVNDGSVEVAVDSADIAGKFVEIVITETDGGGGVGDSVTWTGYVAAPGTKAYGELKAHSVPGAAADDYDTGINEWTCYGMEFYLQRHDFASCVTDAGTVGHVVGFNTGTGSRNRARYPNRSTGKTGGSYTFSTSSPVEWTALDVAEHILRVANDEFGTSFALAGQSSALANITRQWDLSGITYFAALGRVISPRDGFVWYCNDQTIEVRTITDVDITVSGDPATVLVPRNSTVLTLNLADSTSAGIPTIQQVENSHYDRIVVRGARMVSCFTVNFAWGNLEKGWTAAEETLYEALSDSESDALGHVFTRYVVPAAWDGLANTEECFPVVNTATGAPDYSTQQKLWRPDLRFMRTLPLSEPAYPGNPRDGELRRPIGMVVDDTGNFVMIERGGSGSGWTGGAPGTLRMMDDDLGVVIDTPKQHTYGKTHSAQSGASYDYELSSFTVAVETDEHVRIQRTAIDVEPGSIIRTKIIDVPDAELWIIIDGTMTDIDDDGTAVEQSGNATIRTDADILSRTADIAQAWYGRRRNRISVPYRDAIVLDHLGKVVSETTIGGATIATGTVINNIRYDIVGQSVVVNTDFFDLDIIGLGRDRSLARLDSRIRNLERQMSNSPIRTGSGGSSDVRFGFTLTQSATVPTRVVFGEFRAESTYGFNDIVTVGLDRLAKTAAENLTVSASGENWIGYKITKSGTTITATPWTVAGTAPPAQVDGEIFWTLGYVTSTGSANSNLRQTWTGGDIHIPARIG